ncbi:MAG: DEAD/DEAH box helicase [Candidatus Bathyarchaeota archaeon]|nr:MAG: DEAD/DEAH box helicase [Candidatus Bathyarchaeota archaeon]
MRDKLQVFQLLAKSVQEALGDSGISKPTLPQVEAIPYVLKGENILLVAPTGSGKTEAVLFPIFSRILGQSERTGISVLYITPLRALNRDMIKRMSYWESKLNLTMQVRHGDTETKIRRRQSIHPPDVLITTPETLQAILPGSRMQRHLSQICCVVIDEVHDLATNKRGVQLAVALERLSEIAGKDFQRIGLSATVENSEEVAKFVAGSDRQVKVVNISLLKNYTYTVEYPIPTDADYDSSQKLRTAPEAAARIRRMLDLVKQHTSTLIFVNSRTNAEMLGHKFSLFTNDVAVHHGSLSKAERRLIEDKFKANSLKAIVCTSTMELGVDIGQVDLVIQYLSPRQIGSLIQRVGRSGHRLDLISKGVIIAAFSEDVLESLASAFRARKGLLEPLVIHENALDVMAHQIAGMLMDQGTIALDEVLRIFHRAHPFSNLPRAKLLDVVNYLDILRELRLEGELLVRTRRTRDYYYKNLSMIPDEKRYPIIDVLSDRRIGTLGDEFMALRSRVGLSFILKGKVWRIVQIEDETGKVYVVPSEDQFAAIPGWDGEMLPIPFDLAQEVGRLRERIARELKKAENVELAAERLAGKLKLRKEALIESIEEIKECLKTNVPLPVHNHILVEAFDKYFIIHVCFGEVVNRTLGSILDAILSDQELIVGWWNDGYRILIEAPRKVEEKMLDNVSKMLSNLSSRDIDKAFNEYVEARFPFSYKMKFVAERFGALPRGKTLSPERMARLLSKFKKTPIYDETIRESLVEKVDLQTVKHVMRDIRTGRMKVSTLLRSGKPTSLAYHILAKYSEVAELMAPEKIFLSNIERMKRSTIARIVRLLCLSCGKLIEEQRIRDLSEKPICKKCGSGLLAKLMRRQDPKVMWNLMKQRQDGREVTPEELEELTYIRRTADLILSYGKRAVIALQAKGVGPETAFRILGRMHTSEDSFFMDLLKAKINFIKSYPYWKGKKRDKFREFRGEET